MMGGIMVVIIWVGIHGEFFKPEQIITVHGAGRKTIIMIDRRHQLLLCSFASLVFITLGYISRRPSPLLCSPAAETSV